MPAINLTTYRDLVEHLIDFMGANPGGDAARDARRAACGGLACLARSHLWNYYQTRGRIATVAPYSTGTVSFSSSTNQVTLTSGTWPSWAALGTILLPMTQTGNTSVAQVSFEVIARDSDSVITLSTNSNPGTNLSAGTTYTLYRDTFPLPIDCTAIDRAMLVGYATWLEFENPGQWLARQQIYRGPALPHWYCVRGDPDYLGSMAFSLFPVPDNQYEIEFMYNRQPRPLKVESYSTGKVSVTSGFATVTGTNTSWSSRLHTGCILRFSNDGTNLPTSDVGAYPAALERVITTVNSTTSITLDSVADQTFANVAYVISDPADIEPLAMRLGLLRACEYQLGVSRNRRDRSDLEQEFLKELIRAREADSRNFSSQSPRGNRAFPTRLIDFPQAADS